jgi:hypothetical protein
MRIPLFAAKSLPSNTDFNEESSFAFLFQNERTEALLMAMVSP